jgi:hypothetical protein
MQINDAEQLGPTKRDAATQRDDVRAPDMSLKSLMQAPAYDSGDQGAQPRAVNSPNAPDNPYQDNQSFGQYLFGSTYADPALAARGVGTPQANWTSYTSSRILVRLFSRGLMGATFYSLANRWIPGQLRGYTAEGAIDAARPIQYLARGFDIAYGKPIQAYVKQHYKWIGKSTEEAQELAHSATAFRVKKDFSLAQDGSQMGRSIGSEVVGMSGDFAAGSVGDAWGRQIANMFDPNQVNGYRDKDGKVHPWHDEDGHWNYGNFAKSVGKNAWQIFSKNQGEDWAAALPYVYQMRFQRVALDKVYRGFGVSSDHQFNGGSWRMNQHGELIDSYAKAGALDLQVRFTGYNWYTLMYRDLYDNISERVKHYRQTGDFSSPETETGHDGLLNNTAHMFRYIAKSAIKATIYMTPAVPFFWITRTPQTKAHGMGVIVDSHTGTVEPKPAPLESLPFARENTRGVFDRITTPFGEACLKASEGINKGLRALGAPAAKTTYIYGTGPTFAETFVNSSASYTPYMIAKAETALRWDRPKGADGMNGLDRASYRFIDGITRLNLGEIKGGLVDLREELIRPPSNRSIGELRAQQRAARQQDDQENDAPDTTVSDVIEETKHKAANTNAKPGDVQEAASFSDWQHKHARAQFMAEQAVPQGATVH